MIKLFHLIIPVFLSIYSCNMKPDNNSAERINKWKQEILETEQSFAQMASEEGIHKAFMTYAAEDAVLMRNNALVIGRKNIDLFYKNQTSKGLTWTPDFVDVSDSGDLGYTYGHYIFSLIDSIGNTIESKGIFHSVWKRQPDGKWLFVWD